MNRTAAIVLAFGLLLAGTAASAPGIVIYRCEAADGAVTIQNGVKCPKGTREQKRVVEAPTSRPVPTVPAAAAAPPVVPAAPIVPAAPSPAATASPAAPTAPSASSTASTTTSTTAPTPADASATDAPRLPPPALFVCLTADAQRYYSDGAESSRCAPAATVGLDGRPTAGAESCEVVQDRCEPVPEAERCAAWAERRRTAEHALGFVPEQAEAARSELARIDAATTGTACGR